jgi:hypothetical protein
MNSSPYPRCRARRRRRARACSRAAAAAAAAAALPGCGAYLLALELAPVLTGEPNPMPGTA